MDGGSPGIGLQPRKVQMKPTMGVDESLSSLAPVGGSYMLVDSAMAQQGSVRAVDSQIPTAYPRVGGVGNMGRLLVLAQRHLDQRHLDQRHLDQRQCHQALLLNLQVRLIAP